MSKPVSPRNEKEFATASEGVLHDEPRGRPCDLCGKPSPEGDEGPEYAMIGSATYLWIRGGEVVLEKAPLCASCASAIGMTALGRWEIEEEEG